MQAAASRTARPCGARDAVRRRRPRHAPALRGDRFDRRHRRRAAQAQLRDLPDRRSDEPRPGWRDHPVRGRPHPTAARDHVGPVPLRDQGLAIPRRGAAATPPRQLKQAVISASALSLMYPPDGLPGYSREAFLDDLVAEAPSRSGGASSVARRPDRLHRGAPVDQARSVGGLLARSSTSTTASSTSSPTRSVPASASTRAPAATTTRPTARTCRTSSCSRPCSA